MKTSAKTIGRDLLLIGALGGFLALCAHAQSVPSPITPSSTATVPAKGIGPAPANTPQHQILTSALSPQTRQTLQEAMNSYSTPASAKSAPAVK